MADRPGEDGYYAIIAKHSGKALDVWGLSPDNGALVHMGLLGEITRNGG